MAINRNKWETFANKNAEMYIDTSLSEVPEEKHKENYKRVKIGVLDREEFLGTTP